MIRVIRATAYNDFSSRSHTMFTIHIETQSKDSQQSIIKAKLNLCDLAGSEKIQNDIKCEGDHFKELKNINLSLSTLSKVIYALAKGSSHVPYRESKLTRLLQDSIGGNSNTIIIANISPLRENVEETLNTLHFIKRAQKITIDPKENKVSASDNAVINQLQNELQYYKTLIGLRAKGSIENELLILKKENDKLKSMHTNMSDFERIKQENKELARKVKQLQDENRTYKMRQSLYSDKNFEMANDYHAQNTRESLRNPPAEYSGTVESMKLNDILVKARELSLNAPSKNRCPICTLPLPCRHYATKEAIKSEYFSPIKSVIY